MRFFRRTCNFGIWDFIWFDNNYWWCALQFWHGMILAGFYAEQKDFFGLPQWPLDIFAWSSFIQCSQFVLGMIVSKFNIQASFAHWSPLYIVCT